MTWPVLALIRVTVLSSEFATQTLPCPTAISLGLWPTGMDGTDPPLSATAATTAAIATPHAPMRRASLRCRSAADRAFVGVRVSEVFVGGNDSSEAPWRSTAVAAAGSHWAAVGPEVTGGSG